MMYRVSVLALLLLPACAGVSVKQVSNAHGSTGITPSADTSGVRFYRPRLHVWLTRVAPSEKVNVATTEETVGAKKTTAVVAIPQDASYSATLTWLPDYSQEYIVQWWTGVGSVKPAITLANGWNLTALTAEVDSKFSENLEAVSTIATSFAAALTKDNGFHGPGLYRLDVDISGVLSLGKRVLALE